MKTIIQFQDGKWQFDKAMEKMDYDEERFEIVVEITTKTLDAAETNEFWKQYNEWKRA